MKRYFYFFSGFMLLLLGGFVIQNIFYDTQSEPKPTSIITGYYWSGWLDARDKYSDEKQEQDYRNDAKNDRHDQGTSFILRTHSEYFFNWHILPLSAPEIPNGSYVEVHFSGVILESYPAKITEMKHIEIIN